MVLDPLLPHPKDNRSARQNSLRMRDTQGVDDISGLYLNFLNVFKKPGWMGCLFKLGRFIKQTRI